MRIIFELNDRDIQRFRQILERTRHAVRSADEHELVDAARHTLDNLPVGQAPRYVRERMQRVRQLIVMLEDEAWALPMPERAEVLKTLAYVADPEDLIPDDVAVIGLLDDAIMLELLMRDLRHVLDAWRDFCRHRTTMGAPPLQPDARITHAARLARRRAALLARMRRRVARDSGAAASTVSTKSIDERRRRA